MKNIRVFLSEIFQFLEVKFSVYLNGRVFVMLSSIFGGQFLPDGCLIDTKLYESRGYGS